jgi:hypothetical protein
MDQPHLIEAMDAIMRKLGGTARVWRVDRMATVVEPATGDVQAKAWWKPRCGSCRAAGGAPFRRTAQSRRR